jgi:uncharacterized membrane protein
MNSIEKAELYFILPINNILGLKKAELEEDQFLQKLITVQIDEFNEKLCASISRKKTFDGEISYQEYTLPLKIYITNYHDYNSSLIYLKVSIHNSIKLNDFSILIHGKDILQNTHVNNKPLFDYLSQNFVRFTEPDEIFLFLQIAKTNPEFPNTYDEGIKFIEEHKQNIHQLLLRSDTYHDHLRIDNHQSNFDSIANFYGTIDLCSPITLIQFYQYPINSIDKNCDEIDIDHRACWWLVITDMIFIQKSVLADTLKRISQVQMTEKMKTVKATTQFGKVLLNMKDFWYFEDLIHEISKAVLFRVKEKVGVTSMLNSVLERVEYLENMILRENNEKQNEHNLYLNIMVLIIAMIQIVPLIQKILHSINFHNTGFLCTQLGVCTQLGLWIQSFVITITLPLLLILILRKINKRKFTSAMLAIKKSKPNN